METKTILKKLNKIEIQKIIDNMEREMSNQNNQIKHFEEVLKEPYSSECRYHRGIHYGLELAKYILEREVLE